MASIGIQFPFAETTSGGIFKPTLTTQSAIRSNLIALLTLKRGQRPMNNDLYSPLYDYIDEPFDDIFQSELQADLIAKINTYIPEITLKNTLFSLDTNIYVLNVTIQYTIPSLGGVQDKATVGVQLSNK